MESSALKCVTHTMDRLAIFTPIPFAELTARFEGAAPPFDVDAMRQLFQRGGSWQDVIDAVDAHAPNGFMIYGKLDAGAVMAVAGHDTESVEYLIGNHVIAERMFRHDPEALLYVPLRVLLYSTAEGGSCLAIDQPSTVLAGLGDPNIAPIGLELDHKFSHFLSVLGLTPPERLANAAPAAGKPT